MVKSAQGWLFDWGWGAKTLVSKVRTKGTEVGWRPEEGQLGSVKE